MISRAMRWRKRFIDQFTALLLSHAFRTQFGQNGDREESILQVRRVADQITDRRTAVGDLAETLQIGTRRLRGWFRDAVIPPMPSPGILSRPDRDLIELRVRELREVGGIQCGSRHTAESIALPGQSPPSKAVYQILHPTRAPVNRLVRAHDHRFVAKYVD
jgi:hypothetical protein